MLHFALRVNKIAQPGRTQGPHLCQTGETRLATQWARGVTSFGLKRLPHKYVSSQEREFKNFLNYRVHQQCRFSTELGSRLQHVCCGAPSPFPDQHSAGIKMTARVLRGQICALPFRRTTLHSNYVVGPDRLYNVALEQISLSKK